MAEDREGQSGAPSVPSPQVVPDIRAEGSGAPPKEPGWYPVRTNPNEQTYWDGTDWVGRRHWSAGTGWTEVGPETPGSVAPVMEATNGPRLLSANPYVAPSRRAHAGAGGARRHPGPVSPTGQRGRHDGRLRDHVDQLERVHFGLGLRRRGVLHVGRGLRASTRAFRT